MMWPGLTNDVQDYCKTCHECQVYKARSNKYGHLPVRDVEDDPWQVVCVDLVGPYEAITKDGATHTRHAMTMVDPATGWFEIVEIPDKRAVTTATLFDRTWLSRYPRPLKVIFDNGNEFLGQESRRCSSLMESERFLQQ